MKPAVVSFSTIFVADFSIAGLNSEAFSAKMLRFKKLNLPNFIKRFSLLVCALLLTVSISGGFAQATAPAAEINIHAYTQAELKALPIDNLKIKITEAENKSNTLEAQIRDLGTTVRNNQGDVTAAKTSLAEKKAKLAELNTKELIPLRLELNSRDSANLKGMITIQGQGIFANAASLLGSIIDYLIKFVGVVAFILLVVGGVRLVVAAGDDNAVQNAKQMITYAIIGLAVALLAYIIVTFVHGLLYR